MMNLILDKLFNYSRLHELNCGLSNEKIDDFEKLNNIILPQMLKEIYLKFNGGELFVPGTIVFGIFDSNAKNSIQANNSKNIREKMSLPISYLIFAKLNYGDLICVNLEKPNNVVQWSHETDELFCEWKGIDEWLSEMIDDYEKYEIGD